MNSDDRGGLSKESGMKLQSYMSRKMCATKPKLRDLDATARAVFERILREDMGESYKMEIALLEQLEREEEEPKKEDVHGSTIVLPIREKSEVEEATLEDVDMVLPIREKEH